MRVVLDTNVLYSGLNSARGVSYRVLTLLADARFETAISVPLALEYEDVLGRLVSSGRLEARDADDALDFLRRASVRQTIFFLWRPSLRDPKDDHVAELAIAAGCDAIVTYHHRDYSPMVRFDIAVLSPHELLTSLGEQ